MAGPHADAPHWTIGDHVSLIGSPNSHGRILKIDTDDKHALVEWRTSGEQSWQAVDRLHFEHHTPRKA